MSIKNKSIISETHRKSIFFNKVTILLFAVCTYSSPQDRPKYGILRADLSWGESVSPAGTNYGTDAWILDPKVYRSRLTLTPGDSIDRAKGNGGKKIPGDEFFHWTAKSWDHLFIPWENRSLIVPPSLYYFAIKNYQNIMTNPLLYDSVRDFWNKSSLAPYRLANDGPSSYYVETQVWGLVKIFKAFEFSETPPDPTFLKILKKNGVEVRDARKWPPKKYVPD